MPSLPTGTVTFLFTFIEDSTPLWGKHPQAMKTALAKHDSILRTTIESHQGHVIKTTGDGVCAVFTMSLWKKPCRLRVNRTIHLLWAWHMA